MPLGSSRWSCAASGSSCGRFGWTTWRGSPSSPPTPTWPAGGPTWTREDLAEKARGKPDEGFFAVLHDDDVVGLVQYAEETDPEYRHAGIDLFLGAPYQDRGLGTDTVRTLARHLVEDRGHHRLTIDPVAHNARAIRAYDKAGFRPVGVMREYQREPDGTWSDGLLMDLLARDLES